MSKCFLILEYLPFDAFCPLSYKPMSKPIPTVEWLHICDHAFRDEFGKLCIIGMFDALHSQQLPGRLPMLSVAIGVTDGEGQYEIALQVQAPSGKTVDMALPNLQLSARNQKQRAVIRLAGMPFEEFGTYIFRLKIDNQPVDSPAHFLDHLQAPQQPGQSPGQAPPTIPPPPGFN